MMIASATTAAPSTNTCRGGRTVAKPGRRARRRRAGRRHPYGRLSADNLALRHFRGGPGQIERGKPISPGSVAAGSGRIGRARWHALRFAFDRFNSCWPWLAWIGEGSPLDALPLSWACSHERDAAPPRVLFMRAGREPMDVKTSKQESRRLRATWDVHMRWGQWPLSESNRYALTGNGF